LSEDVAVAKGYPTTQEKSEVVGGTKLTILTKKKQYQVGEEVRVIHVLEVVEPGHEVFITGPIYGEYVDDSPVTPELPLWQIITDWCWRARMLIITTTLPPTDSLSQAVTVSTGRWVSCFPIPSNWKS